MEKDLFAVPLVSGLIRMSSFLLVGTFPMGVLSLTLGKKKESPSVLESAVSFLKLGYYLWEVLLSDTCAKLLQL